MGELVFHRSHVRCVILGGTHRSDFWIPSYGLPYYGLFHHCVWPFPAMAAIHLILTSLEVLFGFPHAPLRLPSPSYTYLTRSVILIFFPHRFCIRLSSSWKEPLPPHCGPVAMWAPRPDPPEDV